ncbi:MAG: dephospho-CoA kinase [Chloroflexota bacterium]|nr:MAG: dephospho-CoA kinase [Chloroflexota bacterium]
MTVTIGITGLIGCGKSTVGRWLEALGAVVIDADAVARSVTDGDPDVLDDIVETFGPRVATPSGSLDRAALAAIVFGDPIALTRLEAIVHPAVRRSILASIAEAEASAAPAIVIEAIKLVEGGLAAACDEVWLVTCEPAVQLERLAGRGMAPADATARTAAQGDLRERAAAVADRIIDTGGTLDEVQARATAAYREALASPPASPAHPDGENPSGS